MKKYIKPKMFKKLRVYTLITFTKYGLELMDVTVERMDQDTNVIIVRELCDVYTYSLSINDAKERLLEQVYR